MIPKIIHYCWFGGSIKPKLVKKCIASWEKFCPDYEIIEWNESNYDVTKNQYMREAYEAKKWGFVSDLARKDIIYQYGGIYFDTDVEIIRPLDGFLTLEGFMGTEKPGVVATGLCLGAVPKHPLIKELCDVYKDKHFINENGSYNLTTCLEYENPVLAEHGFQPENIEQEICGIHIFPTDCFCPQAGYATEINITENTYTIHHYMASWVSPYRKFRAQVYWTTNKLFGNKVADLLRKLFGRKDAVLTEVKR